MAYVWAAIILLGLFFVARIMRNYRMRNSEEERTKRLEIRRDKPLFPRIGKRWRKKDPPAST